MKPINYGPLRDLLSLADGIGPLVLFGLMGVGFALFALQQRGVRIGGRLIQPSEPTRDLMLGLLMAAIGPVIIVSGAGHYILRAGTGYFQVPSDDRNSQAWVDGLYVFMAVATPVCIAFSLAISSNALLRRYRLQHPRPAPSGAAPAECDPERRHHKHHKHRGHDETDQTRHPGRVRHALPLPQPLAKRSKDQQDGHCIADSTDGERDQAGTQPHPMS